MKLLTITQGINYGNDRTPTGRCYRFGSKRTA